MPAERVIVCLLPEWMDEAAHDEPTDATRPDFAQVFTQFTELVPHIETPRPGVIAMRARGPARFYGGEEQAASALLDAAHAAGSSVMSVGIADGRFAAEQAARVANSEGASRVRIIDPGGSAAFLSPLPVGACADDRLTTLLPGLGIYTLGAFAALPEDAVRARFGPPGVLAHRHARGEDAERGEEIRPQQAERDWEMALDFEPPLTGTEQLAFACSPLAERLSTALASERLVCTTLRVSLTDDVGVRHEREWAHPRFFTTADIVARIRWQAETLESGGGERTGAGIVAVRICPVRTDRAVAHEPGLWTTGPDERVHHHLSRAQGLLGPRGVGTATLGGGRLLRDRQRFTAWGDAPQHERTHGSWPGALSGAQPSLVFSPPLRALLLDADGVVVGIDEEDLLAVDPRSLRIERYGAAGLVRGWSRPWPIRERWWEARPERFRLQVELESGDAWVLLGQTAGTAHPGIHTRWFAEGRYD